jgi:peptidyl-tRNA hydrolase, PTH1 family
MKVVVGLGNPGRQYAGTRHNVGFAVLDALAAGPGVAAFRSRFQAQVAEANEGGRPVLLVKPETFMNLSGQAVRQAVDFYKVPLDDLLVVCDDFALPLGKLRVRAAGTHGGHNGLRSLQEHLGTTAYARLRVGVGGPREDAIDHVLGRFRPGERPVIEEAVQRAVQAVLVWVSEGVAACMNRFNGDADPAAGAKKKRKDKDPDPGRAPNEPQPGPGPPGTPGRPE